MLSSGTKVEILSIGDKLAQLEKKRNDIRWQQFEVRDRMNVIRARNLVQIAGAKDDKNKPLYTNDKVREAALTIALDGNSEYRILREKVRALQTDLEEGETEYHRLSYRRLLLMVDAGLNVNPLLNETGQSNIMGS